MALDSGLSTGGFTDCLLQHGASFVYGVDVGYGQVDLQIEMFKEEGIHQTCTRKKKKLSGYLHCEMIPHHASFLVSL